MGGAVFTLFRVKVGYVFIVFYMLHRKNGKTDSYRNNSNYYKYSN